ncbi:MAG: tannase/feruloyl esterase family alpha/beta hydrolase, partial [Gammaproteobacteria bacterium]|nr:tannase/feruloyl esterase family alpha/beta hydrolase [Gammaproteobacteria bacterium]
RETIDDFARLYVSPQAGHVLRGASYTENGEGQPVTVKNISRPNGDDNLELIMAWVEENNAPPKTLVINTEGR